MNYRGIRIAFVAAALAVISGGAVCSEAAPRSLTVAVVSSQSVFGDAPVNLAHFEKLVAEAASQGARLVCFPELALVGYGHHPDLLQCAQPIPGPASDRLAQIARQNNVFISAGMAERDGEQCYITQMLVGPEGYLGKYRKCFPTGKEQARGFSPGDDYPTWDIDGFRLGILICFDGRQEATLRAMKQAGADIIHHPHGNFGKGRDGEEWTRGKLVYFAPRAIAARAHMLVNNSAGDLVEPDVTRRFPSGALVIDALGQAVARTREHDQAERMLVVTLPHPLSQIPPDELRMLMKSDADLRARVERKAAHRESVADR